MSGANRLARVNELLKRELGYLCEREGFSTSSSLVTITEVKVSPDLRYADVLVSVFGDDAARQEAMRTLARQRIHLQAELARRVTLKYTPVLRFHDDRTAADADRVMKILDELEIDEQDEEQ
jgi:ribosome-binding factor A